MANIFVLTAATTNIKLNGKRQGEVVFTVSNATQRPLQGRAHIVPEGEAASEWFSLDGEAEQAFAVAGTQQISVEISVPPNAPAGDYYFRLNMVGVENPDEDFAEGPSVSFAVPEPEKKRFPWWILLVIFVVLLIVGGGVFALTRMQKDENVEATPTVESVALVDTTATRVALETAAAEETMQAAEADAGTATALALTAEAVEASAGTATALALTAEAAEASAGTATAVALTAEAAEASAGTATALALTAEAVGDNDSDGLSNSEEQNLQTDPDNPDTDGDGLTDGQEVNEYMTDPRNSDSDGDNILDGVDPNPLLPPFGECWPIYESGDSGPEVQAVRYFIALKNPAFPVSNNETFDGNLETAIRDFQGSSGLPVTGKVDENTWRALIVMIRRPNIGHAASAVQYLLNEKFNYNLDVDGNFGPLTDTAVRTFQGDYDLTVDGIVGPITWSALLCAA